MSGRRNMVDLSMTCRKDGKTAREALSDELLGFAVCYTPDDCPNDKRTLVIRWPAFVTFVLIIAIRDLLAGHV